MKIKLTSRAGIMLLGMIKRMVMLITAAITRMMNRFVKNKHLLVIIFFHWLLKVIFISKRVNKQKQLFQPSIHGKYVSNTAGNPESK